MGKLSIYTSIFIIYSKGHIHLGIHFELQNPPRTIHWKKYSLAVAIFLFLLAEIRFDNQVLEIDRNQDRNSLMNETRLSCCQLQCLISHGKTCSWDCSALQDGWHAGFVFGHRQSVAGVYMPTTTALFIGAYQGYNILTRTIVCVVSSNEFPTNLSCPLHCNMEWLPVHSRRSMCASRSHGQKRLHDALLIILCTACVIAMVCLITSRDNIAIELIARS